MPGVGFWLNRGSRGNNHGEPVVVGGVDRAEESRNVGGRHVRWSGEGEPVWELRFRVIRETLVLESLGIRVCSCFFVIRSFSAIFIYLGLFSPA